MKNPYVMTSTMNPLLTNGKSKTAIGVHRVLLLHKLGAGPQKCHWCHKEVLWGVYPGIYTDHLNGNKLDNDPDNLVPSCARCNSMRGRKKIPAVADDEIFIERHHKDGRITRHRAIIKVCLACKKEFKFIPAMAAKRPNRGKVCSVACKNELQRRIKSHLSGQTAE